jgi:hypothetical protein
MVYYKTFKPIGGDDLWKYTRHFQYWRWQFPRYERHVSTWNSSLFFIAFQKSPVWVFSKWPLVATFSIWPGKFEDVSVWGTTVMLVMWNIFWLLQPSLYLHTYHVTHMYEDPTILLCNVNLLCVEAARRLYHTNHPENFLALYNVWVDSELHFSAD